MATSDSKTGQNFPEMTQRQLEIYALELYAHFHEERRLLSQVEDRNRQLEQRVSDLASLTQLFQGFLEEYFAFLLYSLVLVRIKCK